MAEWAKFCSTKPTAIVAMAGVVARSLGRDQASEISKLFGCALFSTKLRRFRFFIQ
jgi:hypothetical protein